MEKTKDNSITFRNTKYDETYHSLSGALTESLEKFVKPCNIPELAKTGEITILDICFGLGYNSYMAIIEAIKVDPNCKITIYALENDPNVFELIKQIEIDDQYKLIKELNKSNLTVTKDNITINLILGDARKTIQPLPKVDAVFLDPFSPPKNPKLWTKVFLSEIKKHMQKHAILTTYSCARIVRDNLEHAGFSVKDGPCVGRRAPSTIAKNLFK